MKLRVKVDFQNFDVAVGDVMDRPVLVTVDGECFEVWPGEPAEPLPAPAPAPCNAAAETEPTPVVDKTKIVLAPIPGVILSVLVKPGDPVVFGRELCILEAMKMKNQIRANRVGIIAAVRVSPGEQVRHGQILFEYGD